MRVWLADYTGKGSGDPWYAANLMIFTKNTRVKMDLDALAEIAAWPEEKKMEELAYMANTIPSSWEFTDYTIVMEKVTRAFTHQLVRTRTASYAQQTMQILDVSGFTYEEGESITASPEGSVLYRWVMKLIDDAYRLLIKMGIKIEHARGILPTNIHTNIVMKANLRTYVDLFHSRISPRNLGEFRLVCEAMRDEILRVHPWASVFIARTFDAAAAELDELIQKHVAPGPEQTHMHKLVDQMRRKS